MEDFKVDFSQIKSYYNSFGFYNEQTNLCIDKLVDYYDSITEETINQLNEIFDFYKYSNRENFISLENDIPELKFVYAGSDFSIIVLLTYQIGVTETHLNYGTIINNPILPVTFKFENPTIEDKFYEKLWEYNFVVFHIWFSSLWQTFKYYECGLKVNISDGQCSDFFYLNDFKWKEKSSVTNTESYPIAKLINQDLTPIQIFENLKLNKNIFGQI
jgi:hypothetical protein